MHQKMVKMMGNSEEQLLHRGGEEAQTQGINPLLLILNSTHTSDLASSTFSGATSGSKAYFY